jgi:DNA-binding beta-propeller fold protein YncE
VSDEGQWEALFLDVSGSRVVSANTDGTDLKTLVSEVRHIPDGVVVDVGAGHIYWTNMGNPSHEDGSILRADINGANVTTIVPQGGTFTPKQSQLDGKNRKLYWSDREGMRVMEGRPRCALRISETLDDDVADDIC